MKISIIIFQNNKIIHQVSAEIRLIYNLVIQLNLKKRDHHLNLVPTKKRFLKIILSSHLIYLQHPRRNLKLHNRPLTVLMLVEIIQRLKVKMITRRMYLLLSSLVRLEHFQINLLNEFHLKTHNRNHCS